MPGVDLLPQELLVEVLKHLSHADRMTAATISKRFAEALNHPLLLKDIWFTVRGDETGRAASVLTKSCRLYRNLQIFGAGLHEFDSEFWGRLGKTLRRLELHGCRWAPDVLHDIFQKCSSLEYLSLTRLWKPLPENFGTGETFVEDLRASLSNLKHLHLETSSVHVVAHLLDLIPTTSTISLRVTAQTFLWEPLITRSMANPRVFTELDLGWSSIRDANLTQLVRAFSESLRELRLGCSLSPDGAASAIAECSRLRHLSLSSSDNIGNAHLTTILRNNPGLEMLDLKYFYSSLTDNGLLPVHEFKKLRRLTIRDCRAITNEFLCRLGDILTLEYLDLRSTQLDLRTIQSIASLKNLEELHLDSYVQSSESLTMICMNLGKLRTVNLGDCRYLSDADGLMLSRLRKLRNLILNHAFGFKDLAIEGGVGGSEMEVLTVEESSLTDLGLLSLVGRHGRLKVIMLRRCRYITDRGLKTLLPRAPLLQKLRLMDCRSIGNEFIEALGACCPWLWYVEIAECATSGRPVESFHERRPTVFVSFLPREFDRNGFKIFKLPRQWGKSAENSSFLSYF